MNYNSSFGPTKCGLILHERVKDHKVLAQKLRSFYSKSIDMFKALMDVKDVRARRRLLTIYLSSRMLEYENDLVFLCPNGMSTSDYIDFVGDIEQRMKYLLKWSSGNLLKK